MANCNKLFLDFSKAITPSLEQMQQMKKSREALEKKIAKKIKDELGFAISFYTQGSGAHRMKTIIIKDDGTYDADRGVYLPSKPDVSAKKIQTYVFDAVNDHTTDGAKHRNKCIRVYYKYVYNIDFPVYYNVEGELFSHLATKDNGWIKDDPWHMITWLEEYKDDDGQLIRIIKYLKAWASKCYNNDNNCKMPSGIALAVWAARNFIAEKDRDDKCLVNTLNAIQSSISFYVSCYSPVEPFDDFTAKLTDSQKSNFKSKLDGFVFDAQKALDEPNQLKSSKIWQKYLGTRFLDGIDEDVDAKANALCSNADLVLNNVALLSSLGLINTLTGVSHKPHRNYGE